MEYNLENIPYSDVINTEQKSYAEFRKELHPNFKKVKKDLYKGYVFFIIILIIEACGTHVSLVKMQ